MKYLVLLFFFPSFLFACSSIKESEELPTFAKILSSQELATIGVFVPTSFEKANATSLLVSYFNADELILQTSIPINEVKKEDEELYKEPNLDGYSASLFHLDMKQADNIQFIVIYKYPPRDDGGFTLCSPTRYFKLNEIIKQPPLS